MDITVSGHTVPRRAAGAVEAHVDGELIMLSPKDFGYFGAEGAGESVWQLIDGSTTVDQIVEQLEASFEAPDGVIRTETLGYVEALAAAGLVTLE